jgi:hypothetical protein
MALQADVDEARRRVDLNFRCIAGSAIAFFAGRLPFQSLADDIERYSQSKNRLAELEGNMKHPNRNPSSHFDESQWKPDDKRVTAHRILVKGMKFSDLIEDLVGLDEKMRNSDLREWSTLDVMRQNLKDEIDSRMALREL